MNDQHDNAADDKAMLERGVVPDLTETEVDGFLDAVGFSPVRVVTVYQVACRECSMEAVDGETYEYRHEAEDAADFHRKIHRGEV